jgi:glycosyltransferase involved in cell wall biosynthesis
MRAPVSVLIPTYNEELHLAACLASVAELSDDVHVVDSFSTDSTGEIAKSFGARFVQHEFEGYALQKNWALDNLTFANEWVLILDADESLTPGLREEIGRIVVANSGPVGYFLNRRFMFHGRWIRHCGWYPSWNLRLFKHRLGRYEQREVDEHLILDGAAGYCRNDMIHEDVRGMESWIAKHNRYSTYNTRIFAFAGREAGDGIKPRLWGNQAERKRFIKQYIWPHLPGRALFFFVYMYFFRLGFMDGVHGLHFCVMHAIFQQFVVAKQWEQKQRKPSVPIAQNSLTQRGLREAD